MREKLSSTINQIINVLDGGDIFNNLVATVIWVIFAGIILVLFKKPVTKMIRRIRPQVDSSVPHVDMDMNYNKNGDRKSDVVIRNSGGEPAYNVYVYLSVEFLNETCSIKSLGAEGVRSGVLGVGKEMHFYDKDIVFDGCSATCTEEIWIEYDNAAGIHFRTVILPVSPRGDDMHVLPPRVIKKRLPLMPGMHYEMKYSEWQQLKEGKKTLLSERSTKGH